MAGNIKFRRGDGRQVQPRAQVTGAALPRGRDAENSRFQFTLSHHPNSWDFRVGVGFLPVLKQLRVKPGVAGVGDDLNPDKMHASARRRGCVIIEQHDSRLGQWNNYNVAWPVEGGGVVHEFIGAIPSGRGRNIRWKPARDWDLFRIHLVNQGVIEPPSDHVMELSIEVQAQVVDRIRTQKTKGARSAEDLTKAEAILDGMREQLAEYIEAEDAEEARLDALEDEANPPEPLPKITRKRGTK